MKMGHGLTAGIAMGLLLSSGIAARAADSDHKFVPSSAPISMRTDQEEETRIGYGYNIINLTLEWKSLFFSQIVREDIGEIDYTVNHFLVGWSKTWARKNSLEVDLMAGLIKSKAANDRFTSPIIGQDVTIDHDGDGQDVGVRVVYGRSLFKVASQDGRRYLDGIVAVSLHGAYFSTENDVIGTSADGLYMQDYTEKDSGIFLRPAIAFQPIIRVHERVTLNPFFGYEKTLADATYKWHLNEGRDHGIPFTDQVIYQGVVVPTPIPLDRETSGTVDIGSTVFMGFDVGIKLFKSGGELSVGGMMSSLSGQNDSQDFTEVHVLYSYPF